MEMPSPPPVGRAPSRWAPTLALALSLAAFLPPSAPEAAADGALPPPEGEVLLVVHGDIERPNVGDEARLDRALLEGLPRTRFVTHTPWTDGAEAFEGVRLSTLLEAVGARRTRFEAIALDDYQVTVEGLDVERYPIIIADTRDGRPMTTRRLGPLWIMFPFDDHPELLTLTNKAFSVWQLLEMDVH